MSNHFTYEIDERNLRVKLKDFELPYNNEAWHKFEAALVTQKKDTEENKPSIKISLNRRFVLPVIFGSIILLFSIVLFNFISIKKPIENVIKNSEKTTTSFEPKVLSLEKEIDSRISQTQVQNESAAQKSESLSKTSDSSIIKPQLNKSFERKVIKDSAISNKIRPINTSDTSVKKKSKRRTEEPFETKHLQDILPVLRVEEKEPEIQLN